MLNKCHRTFAKINRNSFKLLFQRINPDLNENKKEEVNFDVTKCEDSCVSKNIGFTYMCEDCPNYKNWLSENSKTEKKLKGSIETVKLSKTQILQFIYLHFLDVIKGKISYVYEKDLCKFLNISLKTVRRNNIALEKANLIKYNKIAKKLIEVEIVKYDEAFEEGGAGTVNIPFNFFNEVKSFTNIDEIRLSLFMYEKFYSVKQGDNSNYENISKDILFKSLKKLFAKGKDYEKYILSILKKLKRFFSINFKDNEFTLMSYKTKSKFDDFKYKTYINNVIAENTENLLAKKKIQVSKNLMNDIFQMGNEYGIKALFGAMSKLERTIINTKLKSPNIGATIRTLIRTNYLIFIDRTV